MTGRPRKEIDWIQFEQLCALQCTQAEMASFLHINVDTLHDRSVEHYGEPYSEIYRKFSGSGKCSLRRNQFVLSKKNAAMGIWLGKQWLGQKDPDKALENLVDIENLSNLFDRTRNPIAKKEIKIEEHEC